MKISSTLAGAALLAGLLAACGGGDDGGGEDGDYCKDIKSASTEFRGLSSGDVGELDEVFKTFHGLADQAPGEVEDDWKTLDSAITTFEKALEDAGLEVSDLAEIQSGQVPEGVDRSKIQGLASELSTLADPKFTKASKAVSDHAKKTCKVDLNAS